MDLDHVLRADNGIVDYITHIHEIVLRLEDNNGRIIDQLESLKNDNISLQAKLVEYRQEILDLKNHNTGVNNNDDYTAVKRKRKRSQSESMTFPVETTNIHLENVSAESAVATATATGTTSATTSAAMMNSPDNVIPKKTPAMVAVKPDGGEDERVYVINGSVGLDEFIPPLVEKQMSYKFSSVVRYQRRLEFRSALEFIKNRLTPEEVAFMKLQPPDSVQNPQEREVWSQQTMEVSENIIRRIKEAVQSERGAGARQSTCTLGAIGDFIKVGKLRISQPVVVPVEESLQSNTSSGGSSNSNSAGGGKTDNYSDIDHSGGSNADDCRGSSSSSGNDGSSGIDNIGGSNTDGGAGSSSNGIDNIEGGGSSSSYIGRDNSIGGDGGGSSNKSGSD